MNAHLLRLIWNRKRHNALLAVEIFFAFLVVLGVSVFAVNVVTNWTRPLGYGIDRVWSVNLGYPEVKGGVTHERIGALLARVRQLPGVEAAEAAGITPYSSEEWGACHPNGCIAVNHATDGLADLLGIEVISGRWFSRDDDGTVGEIPVVINQRLARQEFGDEDALGKVMPSNSRPLPDGTLRPPQRVVGVIDDFRVKGELGTSEPYLFSRVNLNAEPPPGVPMPRNILLRVAPGTPAEFEETILAAVQPIAPDWSFAVTSLDAERQASFQGYRSAFIVIGSIAGFLMLMVALGLTGVVWQMVTERTREFGLRRAGGAAVSDIRRQVFTELALIASLAVVPGAFIAAQIPALPMPSDWLIPDSVFLMSVAVSVTFIYLVVLVCAWYPSRLATRIHPAEALHYE
jgi:putative ABC transport system permease protein